MEEAAGQVQQDVEEQGLRNREAQDPQGDHVVSDEPRAVRPGGQVPAQSGLLPRQGRESDPVSEEASL